MTPEIATQLIACGIPVFPCWDNKKPAIDGGLKSASINPGSYWPSGIIGITIPVGVFVIDVDLYKGVTREAIESVLNCRLDWESSFLQNTPGGGCHHAFKTDNDSLRQGSDLFIKDIGKGFDTRAAGRGYICAGAGYTTDDPIGLMKMVMVDSLPPLPDQAIQILSAETDEQYTPAPLPDGDRNSSEIERMLSCLDADCSRDEWLRVGLALKHHYHDDDTTGFTLFDNWSMSGGDAYDTVEARKLWDSVKPVTDDGRATVTLGTLVHKAIDKGYVPSSVAAAVFGTPGAPAEPSADLGTVETLIARINADGGKPEMLDTLTAAIRDLPCNSIQRVALTATLQRVLKEHGMKISERDIKQATMPHAAVPMVIPQPVDEGVEFRELKIAPIDALGNVHRINARMLQQGIFGKRLISFDQMTRWWSGHCWQTVDTADLKRKVSAAFEGSDFGKNSIINGTEEQLHNVIPVHRSGGDASQLIFFNNGVLDLTRPDLGIQAHKPDNFNTFTLTVNYEPGTPHPEWNKFLHSIFSTEPDRIQLLQEIFGWSLITDNLNHQKAAILDGKSRSGKGTVLEVLNAILGESMIATPLDELHDPKHLSNMRAAMVATDTDAKGPPLNDIRKVHGVFNKLTANEKISLKLLWEQSPWVGRLNCKMVMASNGIPVISDDAGAAPNRWLILKFTETFLGNEDLHLAQRLITEKTAIAAWAVEGLRRLMQNGNFTLPQSSIQETALLVESSSPVSQFIQDRIELCPGESCHITALYETYRSWCRDAGEYAVKRTNFRKSLLSILPAASVQYVNKIRIGDRQNTGIIGVRLKACTDGVGNVTPITQASRALAKAPQP